MGAAVAVRLHQDGYQLVLADMALDKLKEVASRLNAEAVKVDVTSDVDVGALVKRCQSGVDALVITAGLSMTMASFERIMEVNLGGTARVLNAFAPIMNKGGAAVCFASIAGYLAGPVDEKTMAVLTDAASPDLVANLKQTLPAEACISGMAYALSKLAVMKLVQRTCVPWGKRSVRICSIAPGVIDTPMGSVERNADADKAVAAGPIPRLGKAEEVANVAAFLCSSQASFMTGCDILVDGGWVGAIQTGSEDSPLVQALAAGRGRG